MTRALVLSVLALVGAAHAQGGMAEPAFSFDGAFAYYGSLCDCDESDYVFRTIVPLDGHAEPDRRSPVVRTVATGRLIEGNDWDVALTVVTHPAMGVLREPERVRGARRMRDPRRADWGESVVAEPFTVPAGTRVEVYSDYAGDGFINYGGVTYEGGVLGGSSIEWDSEGESPAAEGQLWFRLVPRGGAPAAWVEIQPTGYGARVGLLCETHGGCVPGFTPTYRPDRQ